MCYELISTHARSPPQRELLQTLLLRFLDSSLMACVHDGYFMLRATVEQCATVCPSETAAEVCHK